MCHALFTNLRGTFFYTLHSLNYKFIAKCATILTILYNSSIQVDIYYELKIERTEGKNFDDCMILNTLVYILLPITINKSCKWEGDQLDTHQLSVLTVKYNHQCLIIRRL